MKYFFYTYRLGSDTKDGFCAIKDETANPEKTLMLSASKSSGDEVRDLTYWMVTTRDHMLSKVGEKELSRIESIAEGID